MKKITIYIDHTDDDADYIFMQQWLKKWGEVVRINSYSTGGWEHIWDLEVPENAIAEIPTAWICS